MREREERERERDSDDEDTDDAGLLAPQQREKGRDGVAQ